MYYLVALLGFLRMAVFALAVVAAVVFFLDWMVRTRRINPFNGVARFTRKTVDPLLVPIERSVLRAGGSPASVPWWGMAAVVVGGIAAISALEYVMGLVSGIVAAAHYGPAGLAVEALQLALGLLQLALLVRVFSSWLPISPYSPWIRWSYGLTEWILAPLRQVIPTLGAIDITPIVAYYLIKFVGGFIVGTVAQHILVP